MYNALGRIKCTRGAPVCLHSAIGTNRLERLQLITGRLSLTICSQSHDATELFSDETHSLGKALVLGSVFGLLKLWVFMSVLGNVFCGIEKIEMEAAVNGTSTVLSFDALLAAL